MAAPEKIRIEYAYDRQILNLILDAPKGNVLDIMMITELTDAVQVLEKSFGVKAIVFQGAEEHFSYGASVREHQRELVGNLLAAFHHFFRMLITSRKPAIALVRGQCLGGGLELAAFCQWIFASKDAQFGQPEIKLGVFPPVGSLVLPYRIGQAAAEDLVLTGRSITAADAKQLGLVYSVSEEPEKNLHQFIEEHILPKSAAALEFAVQSSRFHMHQAFLQEITKVEHLYTEELMRTEDANEGIQAFMQKRSPVWKNR